MVILVKARYIQLLNALVKNPTASFNQLAKVLGVSPSTVRNAFNTLVSEEYISLIYAIVNYPAIQREIVATFIEAPSKTWPVLERALDEFFYLRTRARCIGVISGVHAFFAIPTGTLPYLREFLDTLKDLNLLGSYNILTPATKWFYSEPNFTVFDKEDFTWNVNWIEWKNLISTVEPEVIEVPSRSLMDRLTLADFKILDRLTIRARISKTELARFAGLKSYELSRRLKFLHGNKVILKYRVALGAKFLERLTNLAINAKCSSKTTRRLAAAFKTLPYQSTFIPTKEGFLLYTLIPSKDFINLSAILHDYCDRIEVAWLDYRHSKVWNIAYEAYRDGKWDSSYEFMVEQPLRNIREKLMKSTPYPQ
ncbi:MAG: hypothetical protein DRJ51_00825 [Thermoprotei archaeon]|nr:MAG: hypothetical protein DRJ51_00825 [Thermoprotei archaeon]RLF03595.1 MAG: hypothetical protein DRJ59_00190 [Thermoprotei archaeon]